MLDTKTFANQTKPKNAKNPQQVSQ